MPSHQSPGSERSGRSPNLKVFHSHHRTTRRAALWVLTQQTEREKEAGYPRFPLNLTHTHKERLRANNTAGGLSLHAAAAAAARSKRKEEEKVLMNRGVDLNLLLLVLNKNKKKRHQVLGR